MCWVFPKLIWELLLILIVPTTVSQLLFWNINNLKLICGWWLDFGGLSWFNFMVKFWRGKKTVEFVFIEYWTFDRNFSCIYYLAPSSRTHGAKLSLFETIPMGILLFTKARLLEFVENLNKCFHQRHSLKKQVCWKT